MAPRNVHTRAHPDPNPPEIVDNLESILRNYPKIKSSTVFKSPLRANSVPENLAALQQSQVDLRNPFRTRSLDDLDQLDSKSSHFHPQNKVNILVVEKLLHLIFISFIILVSLILDLPNNIFWSIHFCYLHIHCPNHSTSAHFPSF